MMVNKNEIIKYFKDLKFYEKEHIYTINGAKSSPSVSSLVKKFVAKVDFYSIGRAMDKRDGMAPGTHQRLWKYRSDVSLAVGTATHYFGELYMFNRNVVPKGGYEIAVKKFFDDIPDHIIPVFSELQMYHKKYLFPGTADVILYNVKTDKYIIADFKTNADLFNNHKGKRLLKPFSHLLDQAMSQYTLQLSFYQILLEQIDGINVEDRIIVWVKKDGKYENHSVKCLTKELSQYLKDK